MTISKDPTDFAKMYLDNLGRSAFDGRVQFRHVEPFRGSDGIREDDTKEFPAGYFVTARRDPEHDEDLFGRPIEPQTLKKLLVSALKASGEIKADLMVQCSKRGVFLDARAAEDWIARIREQQLELKAEGSQGFMKETSAYKGFVQPLLDAVRNTSEISR